MRRVKNKVININIGEENYDNATGSLSDLGKGAASASTKSVAETKDSGNTENKGFDWQSLLSGIGGESSNPNSSQTPYQPMTPTPKTNKDNSSTIIISIVAIVVIALIVVGILVVSKMKSK